MNSSLHKTIRVHVWLGKIANPNPHKIPHIRHSLQLRRCLCPALSVESNTFFKKSPDCHNISWNSLRLRSGFRSPISLYPVQASSCQCYGEVSKKCTAAVLHIMSCNTWRNRNLWELVGSPNTHTGAQKEIHAAVGKNEKGPCYVLLEEICEKSWWSHVVSGLPTIRAGNSSVIVRFWAQRPIMQSLLAG